MTRSLGRVKCVALYISPQLPQVEWVRMPTFVRLIRPNQSGVRYHWIYSNRAYSNTRVPEIASHVGVLLALSNVEVEGWVVVVVRRTL